VVADGAVVPNVGMGHQEIVVSGPGGLGLDADAAADVYAFFEVIEIPYGEGCVHSRPVPEILRFRADGGTVTERLSRPIRVAP